MALLARDIALSRSNLLDRPVNPALETDPREQEIISSNIVHTNLSRNSRLFDAGILKVFYFI